MHTTQYYVFCTLINFHQDIAKVLKTHLGEGKRTRREINNLYNIWFVYKCVHHENVEINQR